MAADKYTLSFGAVRPTPKGTHKPTLDYKYLNIVTTDDASYICANRAGAPSGTSLEDGEYWQLIARNGLDGAVTFATNREYESEAANKAVAPSLLKPLIDEINVKHDAFEKYGKGYDSARLNGKSLEEVKDYIVADADVPKLGGLTLNQVLGATAESLLEANGYVKLANGLIIQWGSGDAKWGGNVVTLPIAFPTACLWVVHSPTYLTVLDQNVVKIYKYSITLNTERSAITLNSPSDVRQLKYLLIGY